MLAGEIRKKKSGRISRKGKEQMLSKDNFTREHIEELRKVNGNDPALLERTVYAFGLLEALRIVSADG